MLTISARVCSAVVKRESVKHITQPPVVCSNYIGCYILAYLLFSTLSTPFGKMPSLNFMTGEDPLSLDRIRSVLVRLEDTIIFSLIERAQFTHSPRMYQKGAFEELTDIGFTGTWLDWFLKETEIFHGEFFLILFLKNPPHILSIPI